MALTSDILATYRSPGRVIRRQLAAGIGEDRALMYVMLACGLIFVGQWPRLSREAHLDPEVPLNALMGAAQMGWLFIAPLVFYLIASVSHLVLRAIGGRGSWFSNRLALFWSLLASVPLWLVFGVVNGFNPGSAAVQAVGAIALAAFLALWALCLRAAEFPESAPQ